MRFISHKISRLIKAAEYTNLMSVNKLAYTIFNGLAIRYVPNTSTTELTVILGDELITIVPGTWVVRYEDNTIGFIPSEEFDKVAYKLSDVEDRYMLKPVIYEGFKMDSMSEGMLDTIAKFLSGNSNDVKVWKRVGKEEVILAIKDKQFKCGINSFILKSEFGKIEVLSQAEYERTHATVAVKS